MLSFFSIFGIQNNRAIYGVQQLANTDFPLGEDLNIIKDAIPQITPLLKEAFGTARSEELQKLGISSQQVLGVITEGLEKLPRVSGGVKGAFENLSDSINVSLGSCELLSFFSIFGIQNNRKDRRNEIISVVNCFHFSVSLGYKTTFAPLRLPAFRL